MLISECAQVDAILVVDDHPLFTVGIAATLADHFPSTEVETVLSGEAALALLDEGRDFDLALIDLNLTGMTGLELIKQLSSAKYLLPSILLSANSDPQCVETAKKNGAWGYVAKETPPERIVAAIHRVLGGQRVFPEHITGNLVERAIQADSGLTDRQIEVLRLLAKGYPNKIICDELCIAEPTLKRHLQAIFRKLEVNNRTACVRVAAERQLVSR